ncbi:MAG TPA: isoprenylcysteine carboxylmethyltransferase family protein [Candidatus Babeliales bacterium]|nr:isoprenylcysteine carboxylmethyltransferase family protein [Candidatus Babeliales bacterium]
MSLEKRTLLNAIVSVPLLWLLIFLPAGTARYWQGWLLITILVTIGVFTSAYFWRRDRGLLERRSRIAEKEPAQKVIVTLVYGLFLAIFVVSALDHRLRWSADIPMLVAIGDLLVVLGLCVYFVVFRENSFAASTIQVAADQRVVSSGPYAVVRHPLYVGLLIFVSGIPLALGSYWGLLLVVPIVPLTIWRLHDEEAFLVKNLPGYAQYRAKVRWRLVPGLF